MLKEYKAFLFRGNLLDLAVAFILGAAFNAVVQSLANDVIVAPISAALGFENVATWTVAGIRVGSFLAAVLSFVVVATVLFLLIKAAARFQVKESEPPSPAPDPEDVVLLREIRDALIQRGPA